MLTLRRLFVLRVFMALLSIAPIASAINLPEGTSKLERANEIDREYVVPLGLKGKVAIHAIQMVLDEGFRCNLQHTSPIGLDEPPLARCIKRPSGFGSLCDELILTLRFERAANIDSLEELLRRLGDLKVRSALPFCPYERRATGEYVSARAVGEKTLSKQIRVLDLGGNARLAYDKLLIDGFYCGFELDLVTQRLGRKPRLLCTKVPSRIKFCFEAQVLMDVEWREEVGESTSLLDALKSVQVKAVRTSCELPERRS